MAAQATTTAAYSADRHTTALSLLNMSGNLPPKVPHAFDAEYLAAVQTVLSRQSPNDLIGAHQFRGERRDRIAGAHFVGRRLPVAPNPDQLIVTNGTQGAITMLMAGLIGRGGTLAIEELSYPTMRQFADMLGIGLCSIPMDKEGMLPDAYEAACRIKSPAAVYALPTLQNPTTAIMSVDRRRNIAEISRKYGVAIIEDDIYSLLPFDLPPPLSAFAPEISWYILGTAKSMAAALKVAYLVAPSAEAAQSRFWPGVRATYWMCAPINAATVTALIENDAADRIIAAVRRETQARQALVMERLRHREFNAIAEGLHVWLKLPASQPRAEFVARVRSRGVEISASDTYFFGKDEPPNAIRFGTGTAPDREAFECGLDAIVRAFDA
ncbi:PLP-dependent aminotransferase family protein [Bradyrhizobium murdochi]|uniref:aminotransferase-like domain-containing protein n=1 Tax=Bradyrhizobium murdochi TaxID=1038859 RepID=UPI0004006C75|nr:PLP-dependent aminotransferase family protein [Bradyrhizobium murdochi]